MVVEGLWYLIHDTEQRMILHGCRVARGAPSISHILFVDDAFLFFIANIDECRTMNRILSLYEKASGQATNNGKQGLMCNSNVANELSKAISFILRVVHYINNEKHPVTIAEELQRMLNSF